MKLDRENKCLECNTTILNPTVEQQCSTCQGFFCENEDCLDFLDQCNMCNARICADCTHFLPRGNSPLCKKCKREYLADQLQKFDEENA